MNRHLKNILVGLGSILAIAPNTNYASNRLSDKDNLSSDWHRIGDDIRKAMGVIDSEQPKKNRRS